MTSVPQPRCADGAAIAPRLREARRPFIPCLLVCRFVACRHHASQRDGATHRPALFGKEFSA
jgi:hypothetical protein